MPRPQSDEPPSRLVVYLPQSLYEKLREAHFDHGQGKVPYGALSKYITNLILRDLATRNFK
jgi:hypothetical protein